MTKVQVVCTIPVLFAYFSKPKDGLEVAEFLNDDLAEAEDWAGSLGRFTPRKNIILLGAIEENQSSMIFLAQKIIQKTKKPF